MSNQKIMGIRHQGRAGPHYHAPVEKLHKVYVKKPIVESDFTGLARRLGGSRNPEGPTTSDGYRWFASVVLPLRSGSLYLYFPWAMDEEEKDGTTTDRHVAAFVGGPADPEGPEVEMKINEVIAIIDEHVAHPDYGKTFTGR